MVVSVLTCPCTAVSLRIITAVHLSVTHDVRSCLTHLSSLTVKTDKSFSYVTKWKDTFNDLSEFAKS